MTELNLNWDWASHLPVLQYFTKEHDIAWAVEIGTGIHSTPTLRDNSKFYTGYEEDSEFYDEMIEQGLYTELDVFKFHLPESINVATRYCELSDEVKKALDFQFNELRTDIDFNLWLVDGLKLLFVDGFTATRNLCLEKLADIFDIVIIHDTELSSYDHYEYDFIERFKDDFKIYTMTTSIPYTSFMVRDESLVNKDLLRAYMDEFCIAYELDYSELDLIKVI